ncbi:MAG: DUF58 domain-containing protein, partial [Candidatus Margulisiibacteriota bacterium]
MISADIYSQVKRLEIETNRILNSSFAGEYNSAFKGSGVEFEEVRPYIDGDDVRAIDWNVTAKLNQPFVKIFREERELSIFLLIDRSASMQFGSTAETKKELLLKISALLSLVSMKNNDRVGLILFTDKVEKVILPKKGRKHVLRIIEEIMAFEPKAVQTNLCAPLELVAKLRLKKSVLFLISDFRANDFERPLEIVARKHDLVPIIIRDPREQELPGNVILRLEDLESGEQVLLNTSDRGFQQKYAELSAKQNKALEQYFVGRSIATIQLETGKPYISTLINYFKRR